MKNKLESEKYKCIKQLRKRTGLPMSRCQELARSVNYDLEKALEMHTPTPVDEEDNIPFYSKEETDEHLTHITCPHCDKEFWCRGFGAG